jgi:hypothetical protein
MLKLLKKLNVKFTLFGGLLFLPLKLISSIPISSKISPIIFSLTKILDSSIISSKFSSKSFIIRNKIYLYLNVILDFL